MIIIGGPTASGKTAIGAMLAKKINGEIISADSMQIYKGMDIGTAKAKDSEIGVKQHLIDICNPTDVFTVVDYKEQAEKAIKTIEKERKIPIIVGGTGFYISSLLYDMEYGNESNPKIKEQLIEDYNKIGADEMHKKLEELDPISAEKIHKNNTKRMLRALEVCISTGKPFSNEICEEKKPNPISPYLIFSLSTNNREAHNKRMDKRVEEMVESGLEYEVKKLIDNGITFDIQSMQGIGYKEWREYFKNSSNLKETVDLIKKNTRAYAKRQRTWFANQYKENKIVLDMEIKTEINVEKIVEYSKLSGII